MILSVAIRRCRGGDLFRDFECLIGEEERAEHQGGVKQILLEAN